MSFKKELLSLIETIKKQTGKTQLEISKAAGYGDRYLSQQISKDDVSPKIIANLKKTFNISMENHNNDNQQEPAANDPGVVYNLKTPVTDRGKQSENNQATTHQELLEVIMNLSRSNSKFADAAVIRAEAEKQRALNESDITRSNYELTQIIKKQTNTATADLTIPDELNVNLITLEQLTLTYLSRLLDKPLQELLNELDTERSLLLSTSEKQDNVS